MLTEKLVTSACCEKQHAHAYLQPFSRKTDQQRQNNDFYGGTALRCPRVQVFLNLEKRKARLGPSKSTFNAENFIRSDLCLN